MYEAISDAKMPHQLKEQADRVRDVVRLIVARLKDFSDKHSGAKDAGLIFEPKECSRWVADISSPIGAGRLVLKWVIQGAELWGVLAVERKELDQYDRTMWGEVWALNVPPYQPAYVGRGADELTIAIDEDDPFGNVNFAVSKFGMRILFAIASGPIKKLPED